MVVKLEEGLRGAGGAKEAGAGAWGGWADRSMSSDHRATDGGAAAGRSVRPSQILDFGSEGSSGFAPSRKRVFVLQKACR